ncbi:hypothetical protein ACRRTK_014022 [Alexandromys fortis]
MISRQPWRTRSAADRPEVPEDDEDDEEALPHSKAVDVFQEGLAMVVQDPLLCDLPIQNATVLDLKKAIQRYTQLKQEREGGISTSAGHTCDRRTI